MIFLHILFYSVHKNIRVIKKLIDIYEILGWQENSFGFLEWNETQYIFYKISMTPFDRATFQL